MINLSSPRPKIIDDNNGNNTVYVTFTIGSNTEQGHSSWGRTYDRPLKSSTR